MTECNKTCFDDLSIALPIFEGAEEQDVVGPLEMFYWMSLFEALPPNRRPIGEPDFAVDLSRNLNSQITSILKWPRRQKFSLWVRPSGPIACRLACNGRQISVMTMRRPRT